MTRGAFWGSLSLSFGSGGVKTNPTLSSHGRGTFLARKFATKKRSQWLRLLRRQAMRRLLRPFTPLVVWCVCVVLPRHKPNTHTMGTKSKFHLNALRFDSIPFSIWFCFWTSASRSSPPARLSPSSSSFLLFLHRLRLGVSLCACAPSHVPSPSPSPSRSRGICYLYPARHNMCKKGGASRGRILLVVAQLSLVGEEWQGRMGNSAWDASEEGILYLHSRQAPETDTRERGSSGPARG